MNHVDTFVKKRVIGRRYGRTCEICRMRKVKCDGIHPCLNCMDGAKKCIFPGRVSKNSILIYKKAERIRHQIQGLKSSINHISNIALPNSSILLKSIESLINRLITIQNQLIISIDSDQIKDYDNSHMNSLEYQLIGFDNLEFSCFTVNHESDTEIETDLDKELERGYNFVCDKDSTTNEDSDYNEFDRKAIKLKDLSTIKYIGLYSDLNFFTPVAFTLLRGVLIKHHINMECIKNFQQFWENYLMILFQNYSMNIKYLSNPLNSYLKLLNVNASIDPAFLMSNLINDLIKKLRIDLNVHSDISSAVNLYDTRTALKGIVKILSISDEKFSSGSSFQNDVRLNQPSANHNCTEYQSNSSFDLRDNIELFFDTNDTITVLFYELLLRSNHDNNNDIEFIRTILDFIQVKSWTEENYRIGRCISIAIISSQSMGLDRWEYYIGLDENTAETCREIWWKCYWWDKWYAQITGKPPMISDTILLSILPKCMRTLEINTNLDCKEMLENLDFNELNQKNVISIGYAILSRTISIAFKSILYNEQFTNYKVFTFNNTILDSTVEQLSQSTMDLRTLLQDYRKVYSPIFDSMDVKKDFYLLEFFSQFSESQYNLLNSMENLLVRFRSIVDPKYRILLDKLMKKFKNDRFKISKAYLKKLITVKNGYVLYKLSRSVRKFMVFLVLNFLEDPNDEPLEKLKLIAALTTIFVELKPFEYSKKLTKLNYSERYFITDNIVSYHYFTKLVLDTYLSKENTSKEGLFEVLKSHFPKSDIVCNDILKLVPNDFAQLVFPGSESSVPFHHHKGNLTKDASRYMTSFESSDITGKINDKAIIGTESPSNINDNDNDNVNNDYNDNETTNKNNFNQPLKPMYLLNNTMMDNSDIGKD